MARVALYYCHVSKILKLTVSCPFGLIEGGTISGVRDAGGSLPDCFRLISHMASANCSGFNFPSWLMSHKFLNSC